MIATPEDPLEVFLRNLRRIARLTALQFMDDLPIINPVVSNPNKIVTSRLYFELLPSETVIRRRVAQYRRNLRLVRGMTALYLLSSMKGLARAIRSASKR